MHGLIERNPFDVYAKLEGDMDGDEVQVEKLAPEHEVVMDDYISKLNVKGINLKNYLPKDANKKIFSNKAQRDEIIRALAFGGDAIAKVANMMNVYGQVRMAVDSINTSSIEGFGDTKSIRIRGLDESIYFEPEGTAIPYREYLRRYIQAALDNAEFMLLKDWGYQINKLYATMFVTQDGKELSSSQAYVLTGEMGVLNSFLAIHKLPGRLRAGEDWDIGRFKLSDAVENQIVIKTIWKTEIKLKN